MTATGTRFRVSGEWLTAAAFLAATLVVERWWRASCCGTPQAFR